MYALRTFLTSAAFLGLSSLAMSGLANAQDTTDTSDRYDFDIQAGHFDKVEIDTKSRLLFSGHISGKINVTACNRHEKWGSGIRFGFKNLAKDERMYFGIACDPDSNRINADWLRAKGIAGVDSEIVDGENFSLRKYVGDEVQFNIGFYNGYVVLVLEDEKIEIPLGFTPETIELNPFGVTGYVIITPVVG